MEDDQNKYAFKSRNVAQILVLWLSDLMVNN